MMDGPGIDDDGGERCVDAAPTLLRDGLERELAAATRAAQHAQREVQVLLDLLVRQEQRLIATAATAERRPLTRRVTDILGGIGDRVRGRWAPEPAAAEDPALPAVMAILAGLPRGELELVLENALAAARRAAVRPVFVTHELDFQPFRGRRLTYEYLPPPTALEGVLSAQDWRMYMARRLDLLIAKWRPVSMIAYGAAARAWLDEIAAEPVMSARGRALIAAGS